MASEPKKTNLLVSEETRINARSRRRWFVLVSIPTLTVVVLAATQLAVQKLLPHFWTGQGTDVALVTGSFVVLVAVGVCLTIQQKRIITLRDDLHRSQHREKEQRRRYRGRIVAISALNRAIGGENDPRRCFARMAELCKDMFQSDRASLMTLDPKTQTLEVRAAIGDYDANELQLSRRALGEGVAGWVALHKKPLLLGSQFDQSRFQGLLLNTASLRSAMIVPLIVREEVAGVLSVANRRSNVDFDEEDLSTLQIFAETAQYCLRHGENTDWMRDLIRKLQDNPSFQATKVHTGAARNPSNRLEEHKTEPRSPYSGLGAK